MAKKKFYAVRIGKKVGVYKTWAECQEQTKGVSGASFKSFATMKEATTFINPLSTHSIENEANVSIIDIFIDGSFEKSLERYSFGLVVDNAERATCNKSFDDARFLSNRNVSGELFGAMYAFKWIIANKVKNTLYRINYDYEGIEKWATSQWKTNKALTKCYSIISKQAMELADIKFNKVPAHSGVKLNEVVDQLAKDALSYEVSTIDLGFINFEHVYDEVMDTMLRD